MINETEKRKELNAKINRMYRQLGKKVYEDCISGTCENKKYSKDIKKIKAQIDAITSLAYTLDTDIIDILEPEKNNEGVYVYYFCPKCAAGNNPLSTHCIRCKEKLDA